MKANPIGVGVIGASVLNPSWATLAHVPALKAVEGFSLCAVSTSNPASAAAAAAAFNVPAFDRAEQLIADPRVELVVVAVKVAHHHALTAAALDAGKMVLTEWPLAVSVNEAEDLVRRAGRANLRTAIGLQARFAPAVQRARGLISEGYIGEVLATHLVGTGMIWTDRIPQAFDYVVDAQAGAGVLAVPMMHALDALTFVLGDFAAVEASAAVRRPVIEIVETGEKKTATAFDHVALAGTLASGAIASVQFRGAPSRGDNLCWEINGTEGDLVLTAANGNLQVADLVLKGGRGADTSVASIETGGQVLTGVGANTQFLYEALARDLETDARRVPDFAYALERHRLLERIGEAARSGRRQTLT